MIRGRRVMEVLKVRGLTTHAVVSGGGAAPLLAGEKGMSTRYTNAQRMHRHDACKSTKTKLNHDASV